MIRPSAKLFPRWDMAQIDYNEYPYFHAKEMAERSEGHEDGASPVLVDFVFLRKVNLLRTRYKHPLVANSWYRSPEYNNKVSRSGFDGPHTTGRAVDIKIAGFDAFELVHLAKECGFSGIGVKQKGPVAGRFLHLDDLDTEPGRPRPWIWSY